MDLSELGSYRAQLAEIDAELAMCTDLQRRNTLMDSRSDLLELIALLTENETTLMIEQSEGSGKASTSGAQLNSSELIGMHCLAPYNRIVDQAVRLHDAVILDVVENPSAEDGELKVKVLYGHPLEMAMKPCEYFLDDRCNYHNDCRFSHGEEVLFSLLQDYQKPDIAMVKEGVVVLVEGENKLWRSARVVAMEGEKLAAQLLATGKEIAVNRKEVYPIQQQFEQLTSEETMTAVTSTPWDEYKQERRDNVTIGNIGDWEKHTRGIGTKLLLKMGYRAGEGLGRKSDGIVHAIEPEIFPKNKSLDACMEAKNRKLVNGIQSHQKLVRKTIAKHSKIVDQPVDVFDLLNDKLNKATSDEKETAEITKIEGLKDCSSTGLNIRVLDLDKQLKELRTKERKLREGITRNQRDSATADKLRKNLSKCRSDIQGLMDRQQKLSVVMDNRRRNKDIF